MRWTFGDCVLDSGTRELFRSGAPIHLSPKAFQLLLALLEERPKALSKKELHERLWPETFVTDTALTVLVSEVRDALGDNARAPRYIRTVPVFGYAFSGHAEEIAADRPGGGATVYRLVGPDREITLKEGENFLGRGPESIIWIDHDSVSRRHARLLIQAGSAVIEDLGSKNGTFVAGKKIGGPTTLRDGDEIRVGPLTLRFRVFAGAGPTRSDLSTGEGG
jgi:DNA-binding winged helix-turn-helix (wHTH) protein